MNTIAIKVPDGYLLEWEKGLGKIVDIGVFKNIYYYVSKWHNGYGAELLLYDENHEISEGHKEEIELWNDGPFPKKETAFESCETHARQQLQAIYDKYGAAPKVTGENCKWRRNKPLFANAEEIGTRCKNEHCPAYNRICRDDFGCFYAEQKEKQNED